MPRHFTRLTRPEIRKLAPGQKITEHGITAARHSDGDVRYSVAVMVDGQRIHRVVGRASDGTTRTQAEDLITKLRSDAREGRLQLPKGRKLGLTFAKAADLYIRLLRESGGTGLAEKDRHFRLHLVPAIGAMPLERISTFTLERYRKNCKACGLATGTINRHLATYRHMSNKLFEWGKIRVPMAMIKLETENNRRDFILDAEEKERLLDAALRDSNPRIWLFVMFGLHTSLRHAEILSGRLEHLDIDRRRLRVRVKGGRWREQPLTRTITEVLYREREIAEAPSGWIFPNPRSRSGHVESMKAPFRRIVIAAGLDPVKVTPHTMRHTAITELAETGAEARTIQAFSGHKSREMVWRYTHARDQRVNEALDRFEEAGTKVERIAEKHRPRS